MVETKNPNITGNYPELRQRVLKLKEIGISPNKFKTYCESSGESIMKWAIGDRPLNHKFVPIVEMAIQRIKDEIMEV